MVPWIRTKRLGSRWRSAKTSVQPGSALVDEPKDGLDRETAASPTGAEDLGLKDLWDEAYNLLLNDKDKKKLMDGYDKFLQNPPSFPGSTQPDALGGDPSTKTQELPIQGIEREMQLGKLVDVKLEGMEAARSRLTIVAKKKVDEITRAIIVAKDLITAAASLEPHAALAWAGVSVLLPVTLLDRYRRTTSPTEQAV